MLQFGPPVNSTETILVKNGQGGIYLYISILRRDAEETCSLCFSLPSPLTKPNKCWFVQVQKFVIFAYVTLHFETCLAVWKVRHKQSIAYIVDILYTIKLKMIMSVQFYIILQQVVPVSY